MRVACVRQACVRLNVCRVSGVSLCFLCVSGFDRSHGGPGQPGAPERSPHIACIRHTVPPYLRPSSARTPIDTPDFPKYGISRNAKYAAVSNAQARMYRQVPRVSLRPRLVRARFSTVTIYRYRVYSREHCTSVRIFSFVPAPCLLGFGGAPGERVSGS